MTSLSLGSKYWYAWLHRGMICLLFRFLEPWCEATSEGSTTLFNSFHSGRQSSMRSFPGFR